MIVVASILLVLFFILVAFLYRRGSASPAAADKPYEPLGVEGLVNIPLLAGIVSAVLLSGV